MTEKSARGAMLQFEVSRKWWDDLHHIQRLTSGDDGRHRLYAIACSACSDVLRNGGTFVVVVTEDKVTMVQRPDADSLD